MAIDSKKRKFLATSLTATMVAAAVAPTAGFAAEAQKSFPDLAGYGWATDSINYLVEKGAIDGYPDGTFAPGDSIKRGEAAKILALTLNLKVDDKAKADFEDAKDHWSSKYIAAITDQKEGVINGYEDGTFKPEKTITRQELAKMVVNAYSFKLDENADVDFSDNTDWGKDEIQILASLGVVDGYDGGVFKPNANVKRAETAIFVHRAEVEDVRVDVPQKEAEAPEVVGVSAINATQVEVKFTDAVDKDDAITTAPYKVSIQGVSFTGTPKLSEDGKTLTLTATAAIDVTDATVSVEPIKSKADANVKTEKYVSKMTYKDEVAPTILSVEAKTNGTVAEEIEVKTSEPLKASTGLVKVNGAYATATIDGTDKIKVTGLSLKAGETHTVELVNIEDKAGNKTVSTKADFTVSIDKEAPTATVSAGESDKEILVTFNKKMDVDTVKAALGNGSVKDEELGAVTTGTVEEVEDSKGTQFIIPVEDTLYADKNSRTLHVVLKDTIKDSLGNKLEGATQSVTLTKDTVKPVATGYKVVKESDGKVKAIEVYFSEGLKAANAGTISFSVVDSNGVLDTTTFTGFTSKAVSAGDKKVVFEISSAKEISGEYAFSFAKDLVTDLSEAGNKSDAFNYTIDFGDVDGEFELEDADIDDTTNNVIKVTFPVAVKGGAVANSATDPANYTLAGKPLPNGTTITLNGTQDVATIKLPESDSVEKDDQAAVFTVSNIKNTTGNKTLKTYTGTVKVYDNVAPVLESARVLDNKTIELTYSENIELNGAKTDVGDSFKIVQGSDELVLADDELTATVASGFDDKLIIKIEQGTDAVAVPGTAIVDGANASIVSIADETTANADASATTFTVEDNAGVLEVKQGSDVVATLDSNGDGTFTFNGVEVTITGGADTNTFTIATTAAKPATFATTLDLNKDITIETLTATPKVVVDKSAAKNEHKEEVKVNVVKP